MNLKKNAKTISSLGQAACELAEAEVAGVLLVEGKQIAMIMTGPDDLTHAEKAKILRELAHYCIRCADSIESGDADIIKNLDNFEDLPDDTSKEDPLSRN